MTAEQFIQTNYYQALKDQGIDIYDVMPEKAKLPAVIFGEIRSLEKNCCLSKVEIVLNVVSCSTSKKDIYSIYSKVQNILESVTFGDDNYTLGFSFLKSSEVSTVAMGGGQNKDGELWQTAILKYTNLVNRKCGKK